MIEMPVPGERCDRMASTGMNRKEANVTIERTGEAFELDQQLTVIGHKLQVGQSAPDFALDYLDPTDSAIRSVTFADSAGSVRLLNVVNSLDTPVCHIETRRWEDLRGNLPEGVQVYTISMDLPYAQARWQSQEGVTHPALSGHRSEQFGEDYGVLIKEWRLLQRAVFVVDRANRIAYVEYVADQMREPNYDAAVAAAIRAAE
jgi:thioredoxin-dependent peroxiredoxin